MQVRGPSLTLRYAVGGDAVGLFELGSDPEVTRFFSWGPYTSIEEPAAYVAGLAGERERGERLDFLIVDQTRPPADTAKVGGGKAGGGKAGGGEADGGNAGGGTAGGDKAGGDRAGGDTAGGAVVGVTGLSEFSRRDRRAVVGTWLGRPYWGSGANREAKALIAWLAFGELGLERLGAYADLGNPRSQVALERIGFTREGVLRRWHRHGRHVHDVIVYSWLQEEFARSALAEIPVEVRGEPPPAFAPRPTELSSAAAPS